MQNTSLREFLIDNEISPVAFKMKPKFLPTLAEVLRFAEIDKTSKLEAVIGVHVYSCSLEDLLLLNPMGILRHLEGKCGLKSYNYAHDGYNNIRCHYLTLYQYRRAIIIKRVGKYLRNKFGAADILTAPSDNYMTGGKWIVECKSKSKAKKLTEKYGTEYLEFEYHDKIPNEDH